MQPLIRKFIDYLVPLALGLLIASPAAQARGQNVDGWVSGELAKYVGGQLRDLPRFRDSTVRFVVFESGRPVANTDEFSLYLRDRLQRLAVQDSGVRIGWQPDRTTSGVNSPATASRCDADVVDILVGLEARQVGTSNLEFSVRAFDAVERSWITGFSLSWTGTLTRAQRSARSKSAVDRTFLGERGVPYQHTEADLMAKHLAHNLSCQLMRQLSGEYRVAQPGNADGEADIEGILALVRHQVAGINSLRVVSEDSGANATLGGQLHPIDRSLHQFWVTLSPTAAAEALVPLSTSVYVSVPDYPSRSLTDIGEGLYLSAPLNGILDELRLVRVTMPAGCGRARSTSTGGYRSAREDCAALRVRTRPDAVVFVLNHPLNRGLVQLGDDRCSRRPTARISKGGNGVTVALPGGDADGDWLSEDRWQLRPPGDTYYAIAVSDSRAAHAIAEHVARLPQRCSESVRQGVRGEALTRWLQGFEQELQRYAAVVDWRAIRVSRVY